VAIAETAQRLSELREAWLNPPDLVERVPEVVPGYSDRILPRSPKAAAILKKRTLTNLYNEPPAWLDNGHRDLDAAVAVAYAGPPISARRRRSRGCWRSIAHARRRVRGE
jgi:type II restriction/modification system DNA methylase subunit YeeA